MIGDASGMRVAKRVVPLLSNKSAAFVTVMAVTPKAPLPLIWNIPPLTTTDPKKVAEVFEL